MLKINMLFTVLIMSTPKMSDGLLKVKDWMVYFGDKKYLREQKAVHGFTFVS